MNSEAERQVEVPLGTGPPTREELDVYYAPKFTWSQLKLFINSGDLGLLKRDKKLQERYKAWSASIISQYGSILSYLTEYRLRWGQPDTLSVLKSTLVESEWPEDDRVPKTNGTTSPPPYFTADTPREYISIILNDWPYSIPSEIEHNLIWTRIPIFPSPHLIPPSTASSLPPSLLPRITARINQDGIWGFTGYPPSSPPPSPSLLPAVLATGTHADWGTSMDRLVISPKGTEEEEAAVRGAGEEVRRFVVGRWRESEWETAWFVNPPRLQSVKGLAHVHVFARHKSAEETAQWNADLEH